MEQLPNLPLEEGKKQVSNILVEITNSPRSMFGLMVGISVLISLFFFGFLFLNQEAEIAKGKKAQEQAQNVKKEDINLDSVSQDQRRKQDLSEIAKGLRSFKVSYGDYPTSLENLVPEFLYRVPSDPLTKKQYDYLPSVDRKNFELKARLSSGDELIQTGD